MKTRSKPFKTKPLLVALMLSPGLVSANTLNNIVVSANQVEQDLASVTSDVTIISAAELKAKRATSLIEVLNTVPGLSFTQTGPLGTATSLYMRGSDNQRTLILIDGVRVQDPSNTSGTDLAHLMVANIERIEIIKGAQSGVWGSDAAAGVINIITKQSTDTHINVEHGAYNTGKSALSTGFKMGDARLFVNASHLTSEGHTAQAPVNENLNQYEKDGYRNTNLSARAIIPIKENQTLTLAHNHTQARAEYDAWNDPDAENYSETQTDLTQLIYQTGSTKLSAEQSLFSSQQFNPNESYKDLVEAQVQSITLSHQMNDLLIGIAYSTNEVDSEKPSFSYPAPTYQKTYLGQNIQNKTTESKSVFATHSTRWRYLTFNEALRYDDYSNFGSEVTGKLGVKLDISAHQSLAVNYGTAYNAPSIIQMLNPWGMGNPDLTPEKSAEASVTYALHGLSLTYFDKKVEDLIEWSTGSQYQNVEGTTKIKGVEAEYKRRFNEWGFGVNYTHLNTEDASGEPLARRPDNQVGLDLNWYPNDQLDINLNGQYIATRGGDMHQATENYSVWNGVINYQIDQTVSAYLKVNNLFDTYYQVVEGYATAQRSAYLGLNARF